jgi:hypothetical protein
MYLRIRFYSSELYSQKLIKIKAEKGESEYAEIFENIDFNLRFKNEDLKNEVGEATKNILKSIDPDQNDPNFCEDYDEIELKYKIAKILESKERVTVSCQLQKV